jgi:hypothetical protein
LPTITQLSAGALHHNTIPADVFSANQLILFVTYYERDFQPHFTTQDRDNLIRLRYANGESVSSLAAEYGISDKRVYQILREKKK